MMKGAAMRGTNRHNWTVDLTKYPQLEMLLQGKILASNMTKDKQTVLLEVIEKWAAIEFPPDKRRAFFESLDILSATIDADESAPPGSDEAMEQYAQQQRPLKRDIPIKEDSPFRRKPRTAEKERDEAEQS